MNTIIKLFLVLATFGVFSQCKKGSTGGQNTLVDGKTFAPVQANGTGNTLLGSVQTSSTSTDTLEDDEDDDPVDLRTDSLIYKSTKYKSITVVGQTTSAYYGISASNTSPLFICTIYFKSRPTSSTSYAIEDVSTSPSTGKAWLVVTDSGNTLIATSGSIFVSVTGSKVTVYFSSITVGQGSTAQTISGSFSTSN